MNITFIPNRSITLVTSDFKVLTATKDNPNWSTIEAAVKANDEQAIINAISMKETIKNFGNTGGQIEIRENDVYFRGQKLFGEDVSRIFSYLSNGFPSASMVKFLEAKLRNENPESVSSLYNFLISKEMPLTDNGTVLGFKGVREDLYSVHTGNEPLISGTRREDGAILNSIGETVWMERRFVLADNNQPCGPGLHVGSRQYAKGWGKRVMVVEFSPENAVSVPNCGHDVLRVNKYKIVGELTEADYLGEVYNGNYARPTESDPETVDVEVIEPAVAPVEEIEKTVKNMYNISDWSKGQATGFKDGKAHQKRKFYEEDAGRTFKKFSKEFVQGYLRGYRDGRN